ncbi:MAG: winged helix-turn-helix domain-containing protein [Hyphomonadaceae bacterium]
MLQPSRVARVNTPILILSGTADIDTKVRGLGYRHGNCDQALQQGRTDRGSARSVRRSRATLIPVIKTGDITVNPRRQDREVTGQRVHPTGKKEYQMLELLSLRKGTTLTKEMFLNHLYGNAGRAELKIIDVFICQLRKKLAAATGGEHYIETVWGR